MFYEKLYRGRTICVALFSEFGVYYPFQAFGELVVAVADLPDFPAQALGQGKRSTLAIIRFKLPLHKYTNS